MRLTPRGLLAGAMGVVLGNPQLPADRIAANREDVDDVLASIEALGSRVKKPARRATIVRHPSAHRRPDEHIPTSAHAS